MFHHYHPPLHPGEILREDFLKVLKISRAAFAKRSKIPLRELNSLLDCKRRMTPAHVIRIALATNTSVDFWFRWQWLRDIWYAHKKIAKASGVPFTKWLAKDLKRERKLHDDFNAWMSKVCRKKMKIQEFEFLLKAPVMTDKLVGKVLAAGCDDTGLGSFGDKVFLSFGRQAMTRDEAIYSALRDLRAGSIPVLKLLPPEKRQRSVRRRR